MENKKFNILIFAPDFYPTNGGYANAITNFVKELENHPKINKIVILTPKSLGNNKEIKLNKCNIIRIPFFKIPTSTFISPYFWKDKVRQIIKEHEITHIFYETGELPNFGIMLYKIAKECNIPFILRIHATIDTETFRFPSLIYYKVLGYFAFKFYRKVKYITSTNSYHIDFVKKHYLNNNPYLISQKVFCVIPNVIQNKILDKEFIEKFIQNNFKELYNNIKTKKCFLTLGRLNKEGFLQKGIIDLIYAIYFIKKEDPQLLDNTKFIVVGKGEMKSYIEREIERLGLNQYFILYDYLPNDVIHYLQTKVIATILLSRFEGLSMFALEALYNGSPLLFTKVGGLVDLIEEEKNGFFVEPQNIENISKKLKIFLTLDKDKIEKMKKESKRTYKEKFDNKKTIQRFIRFLEITR